MKNLFFVLLASVLAFGAGCSNEQATNATSEPAATAPATSPAPADAPAPANLAPAPAAPAAVAPSAPKPVAAAPAKPAAPRLFDVPQGTELTVVLIDPISSATNKAGDNFTASLAEPLVVDGQTVAAKGALVNGRVVDAE